MKSVILLTCLFGFAICCKDSQGKERENDETWVGIIIINVHFIKLFRLMVTTK